MTLKIQVRTHETRAFAASMESSRAYGPSLLANSVIQTPSGTA